MRQANQTCHNQSSACNLGSPPKVGAHVLDSPSAAIPARKPVERPERQNAASSMMRSGGSAQQILLADKRCALPHRQQI